jgi:hypothetical protein
LHANPLQNSPTFINFNVLCMSRPRVFPEWHLHCHCASIQKRPRGLKTASPREQFVNIVVRAIAKGREGDCSKVLVLVHLCVGRKTTAQITAKMDAQKGG